MVITTTNAGEDMANQEHCWWECKLIQSLWKTIWRFFRKLKIELPYDPVILFLGIFTKEHKIGYNNTHVHLSTIHNSKALETT
jgi:hypothetical protein